MSTRIKVLGLSDPLTAPTGFGRVAREIFARLDREKYDLAYVSRAWVGSKKFDLQTYSGNANDEVSASATAIAAQDFGMPLILWTLLDAWQTGWISHNERNAMSTPISRDWVTKHRKDISWVGYYPCDAEGLNGPPLWMEDFFRGPDALVHMSRFSERQFANIELPPQRTILHGTDTKLFHPKPAGMMRAVRPEKFVVICVMANRRRKYWPDVIQSFRHVLDKVPNAHLYAVCGNPDGDLEDSWSLKDVAMRANLPADSVSFITVVTNEQLGLLYRMSDVALLLSGGEGFGLPQLEAHASGLPCVIGNYSASTELAVHPRELVAPRAYTWVGNNLLKRPVYDSVDVADRIVRLARDEALRAEIGELGAAQGLALAWENIMPEWDRIFTEQWEVLQHALSQTSTAPVAAETADAEAASIDREAGVPVA